MTEQEKDRALANVQKFLMSLRDLNPQVLNHGQVVTLEVCLEDLRDVRLDAVAGWG
ncbi:MAG: hypothetical protein ACHQX3_00760 [Nitrospirales bacterium]